jgi:hypothetical protein
MVDVKTHQGRVRAPEAGDRRSTILALDVARLNQ